MAKRDHDKRHQLVPEHMRIGSEEDTPELRDVLTSIGSFLKQLGYNRALAALRDETEKNGMQLEIDRWNSEFTIHSRFDLLYLWVGGGKGGLHTDSEEDSSDDDEAAGGALVDDEAEVTNGDSSDEESDSDSSAHAGQKRKRVVTPSSSESDDSSSESDSNAMQEDAKLPSGSSSDSASSSDESDARPSKRAKMTNSSKRSVSRDSSSSSDSESDSGSDSDSSSDSGTSSGPSNELTTSSVNSQFSLGSEKGVSITSKSASSRSRSSSSSESESSSNDDSESDSNSEGSKSDTDSTSSSDSDSDDEPAPPAPSPKPKKKVKKEPFGALDVPKASMNRSGSATSSSATLAVETPTRSEQKDNETVDEKLVFAVPDTNNGNGDIHPDRFKRMPELKATPTTKEIPATKENIKKLKKDQVPFSRIPADQKVDPKFASNQYQSYDYADRAYQDLSVTKGKGFTKEKNKKKKGAYRGGAIDLAPKGIKFED